MVDGIFNINKPLGRTSFSLVAMVKRLSGERRVGHAGTLDPAASGVLPVCLGQGTRVVEFLLESPKAYRAEIELGVATDTYDATGRITQQGNPAGISQNQLESALASFSGLIRQTPPMYSAVKYHGKPLYRLARAGITVERKSRLAKVYKLELVAWQPPVVTIEVVCGRGTYIRSLAHDLGQVLGCGAYLKSLIRLSYGPFDIRDAISPDQLEDACRNGYWRQFLYPLDSVISHWPAVVVSDELGQRIRDGRPLAQDNGEVGPGSDYFVLPAPLESSQEGRCRLYALDGRFLGVLRFNLGKGQWQAEKMFLSESSQGEPSLADLAGADIGDKPCCCLSMAKKEEITG